MKEAFLILSHALRTLAAHPLQTLRILSPALLLLVILCLVAVQIAPHLLTRQPTINNGIGPMGIAIGLGFVVGYSLLAILWHRHALRSSGPTPLNAVLFGTYLWRVFLISTIQLVFSLAIVSPLLLAEGGGTTPSDGAKTLVTFLAQLAVVWISLRLSLILPAAALGKPISLANSWRLTDQVNRPIWGIAAILAGLNTVLGLLTSFISPEASSFAFVVQLPVYIMQGLIIFGVLTTLYAYLIDASPQTRTLGIKGFVA